MPQEQCFKCVKDILVDENVIKFDDNLFHSSCFTCVECDKPLGGIKFIRHPQYGCICLDCDEKMSVKCIKCIKCNIGFKSGESYKRLNGTQNDQKLYHAQCLTCSTCNVGITGEFYDCTDRIICIECQRKRDAENSKICTLCKKIINYKFIVYKNEPYHQSCFKCETCNEAIESAAFYQVEEKEPICGLCHQKYLEKTANKCTKCSKPITHIGVQFEDLHFHNTCLTCASCNCILENSVFTNLQETYCEKCYSENYAKKCEKCKQMINQGDLCAIFEDKYFHKMCFTCEKCKTLIAEVKFVKRDSQLVCIMCKDL
jgi:hypothetical protein